MIQPPLLPVVPPPVLAPPVVTPPSRPRKPAVWPVYVLFISLLGSVYAFAVVLGTVAAVFFLSAGDRVDVKMAEFFEQPWVLMILQLLGTLIQASILTLFLLIARERIRSRLLLVNSAVSRKKTVLFALGGIGLSIGLSLLAGLVGANSHAIEMFVSMLTTSGAFTSIATAFTISVIAPIFEEMVFRGYIQSRLIARHGPILGIAITSLMFGIFHMEVVQGTFAVGMGAFLGLVAWRAGSIVPAIWCHAAVNTLSTITIMAGLEGAHWEWGLLAAFFVFLPVSLYVLWRLPQPVHSVAVQQDSQIAEAATV